MLTEKNGVVQEKNVLLQKRNDLLTQKEFINAIVFTSTVTYFYMITY